MSVEILKVTEFLHSYIFRLKFYTHYFRNEGNVALLVKPISKN